MNKHHLLVLALFPFSGAAADPVDLAWLQGHWCQQTEDGLVEEFWLAPENGETVGLGRTLSAGKTASFEFMRIISGDGGLQFIAQPGGAPPTTFKSTPGSAAGQRIEFENPAHDFPQAVRYWREGEALLAEISGPGSDGTTMSFRFHYSPCASGPG